MNMLSLAAVFDGTPGRVDLKEIPVPVPRSGEILVRVESCTLCGSDLHSIEGRRKVPVPTILGHEIIGRIAAFGNNAPRVDADQRPLNLGTRIVWSIVASCGDCFYCTHGLTQKCQRSVKYGHEAFRPGYELLGGLAEYCLLTPGTTIVALADDMPAEVINPCSCATATVCAAFEGSGDLTDQLVCITGAGMLGQTATAIAKARGAAHVVVADPDEYRRAQALRFGATHSVAPDRMEPLIRELTNGRGADFALELSGSPHAFQSTWPALRLGAQFVLVGAVFPVPAVPLLMEQLIRRNITLRGVHNYQGQHLLEAVRFLESQPSLPFREMVSLWFPLSQIDDAIEAARQPSHLRVGVRPQ